MVGATAEQLAQRMRAERRAGEAPGTNAREMFEALGGGDNVRRVESGAGRLLVQVADAARVDERALAHLGARGVARSGEKRLQVLVADAAILARELTKILG